MRKLIAAINMTLDGYCDHTAVDADDALHQHYSDLLKSADTILYGRITYQLMEYWPTVLENPTGNKATDEFALVMNKIQKIVFSRTLKHVTWDSAKVATRGIEEEVSDLKRQPGKDILAGSPSLILASMQRDLVDEYQFCVHPVIAGSGLPLFRSINDRVKLNLLKTKVFGSGAIVFYYEPVRK